MSLTPEAIKTLSRVSTATITTVLLKKGLRNVWMRGSRPLRPGQPRLVGPAFTLRFVPAREDLATPESWSSPISTRTAIEAMPEGCIAVVDAMGVTDAGIFGDILCARMVKRGVAALVTDGVVRDLEGVLGTGLPVWCDGYRRAAFGRRADLRRLGRADRLRRRRGVPERHHRRRPGRRGGDPAGVARSSSWPKAPEQERMEAWIVERGEQRRGAARPLSDERRDQGALRGFEEITDCNTTPSKGGNPWTSISPVRGRPAARRRNISPARCWQDPIIATEAPARLVATRVSFEPGARTAWHTHPLGQTLYVISGVGRVQTKGGPVREIRPGRRGLDSAGRKALAWRRRRPTA